MEVKYNADDFPTFRADFDRADAELENCGRCTGNIDKCPNVTRGHRTIISQGWPPSWPAVYYRPCTEMLKRQAAQQMEARMSAAGLSTKFWGRTFERFDVDEQNREAYKTARRWASSCLESKRWLLLYGRPGTGKTHLGVAALQELIKQDARPRFLRAKDAIYQLHESYQSESTEQLRDEINGTQVLMLDDIGEENDKDKEFIVSIIKSRYEAELPTILTSNLDGPDALIGKYGEAIFSRLEEICDVAHMMGSDYRVKLAKGGTK